MGRTPLTEEEKAARKAAREAAAQAAEEGQATQEETGQAEKTGESGEQLSEIELLRQIIGKQQAQIDALMKTGGGETAAGARDAVVTVLYIAEVSPRSVLTLPGYGSLRPNSYLQIPKMEFGGRFMSELARKLIDSRHLLVVDGLNEDERIRWNCDYKEGEVLSERAFDRILDLGTAQLCDIFSQLCPEHQRFVACRFITAKERNDNRVSLEKVKAINTLSRKNDPDGMLAPVLEAFKQEI